MTSSTPEPPSEGGARILVDGRPVGPQRVLAGGGILEITTWGHEPGALVPVEVGDRELIVEADERGCAELRSGSLLRGVAGDVRVRVAGSERVLRVRPTRLAAEHIRAMVDNLEQVAVGLAQSEGAVSHLGGLRSRDREIQALDRAVALAASAAPGIRRWPISRPRQLPRAVAAARGAATARDVRWLASHPAQQVRAAAAGRPVAVVRGARDDLDTLENRGVLSAYDRIEAALGALEERAGAELRLLDASRPEREAFQTDTGSLWSELDAPRRAALSGRLERLTALEDELRATRLRAGLPDLRPRGPRMVRTPRVDAEPPYWATFRAFQLAEQASAERLPPMPAPVASLSELWEMWCVVQLARGLSEVLGPAESQQLVERGWFSSMRRGCVARWERAGLRLRLLYEPRYAFRAGEHRKLQPGRPWAPDAVLEIRWPGGDVDLHVFDAKYRSERGGVPWEAVREIWWKYAEGIGDASGWPLVRSVWALWPGQGVRLISGRMLDEGWPQDRVRGGGIGLRPGEAPAALRRVLQRLLGPVVAVG